MKKTYLLLFIAVHSFISLKAQVPSNDDCANATSLTVNGACISGTTNNGTTQSGELLSPSCAGSPFTETVWYKFTATDTKMWVQLYSTGFSGSGAQWAPTAWTSTVYNASFCLPGAGNVVSCQNSNSSGSADKIIINNMTGLTVGQTYLIQVGYATGGPVKQIPDFCVNVGDVFNPVCNTCASACGAACGFSTSPTVPQVTNSCTQYLQKPYVEGDQSVSQCYTFTAVNSTVSFQVIVQSTCVGGNVTSLTWTLFKTGTCGAAIQSGTLSNLTFTGLTVGTNYTYCYTLTVPTDCYHSIYWPYFVGAAPLPVELISFSGDESSRGIELKWATASEINDDHFIIERSTDNSEYEFVGKVSGAGNSTSLSEYHLLDANPAQGINYYHLVQVDYDGTAHDYAPIAVSYFSNRHALIVPNPVTDMSILEYFSDVEKPITISIIDQTGRLIFNKQQTVAVGKNSLPLNTAFLSQGIYFLNITDEGAMEHVRFSK